MPKSMKIVTLGRIRQEFNMTDRQQDIAAFYGYETWRRFKGQAVKGRVLGITYQHGRGIIFHKDDPYEMVGPVPDIPQEYLLPPGTQRVAVETVSGLISSQGYIVSTRLDLKHPSGTFQVDEGYSGAPQHIICVGSGGARLA